MIEELGTPGKAGGSKYKQKSRSPEPTPGPSRPRREAAKKVDYAGMDKNEEEEDEEVAMSDESESDYSLSDDDEEEQSEEEDDMDDLEEPDMSHRRELKKDTRKLGDRGIPENVAIDGDSPEMMEQLYVARQELRRKMHERKQMRGQEYSSKYTPDQEDLKMIEEFLCAPVMEGGAKWRKYRRKQSDYIKAIVKSGKLPAKRNHPALQAVAYTVLNYKVGPLLLLKLYSHSYSSIFREPSLSSWGCTRMNWPRTCLGFCRMGNYTSPTCCISSLPPRCPSHPASCTS